MPRLLSYRDREDGFTLVELLIVVLIIGILAAIAIPVYLGIQGQGYKSAVRADVNISVKRVQVALVEGKNMTDVRATAGTYTQRSVRGESVSMGTSPSGTAGANDYSLTGSLSTTSTPIVGPINYTYAYDSVTGKFSESDVATNTPSVAINTTTLPAATLQKSYSQQIDATVGNPTGSTTYTASGLPAWLNLNASTGLLTGTSTTVGSYTFNVTVTNGSATDGKTYTLTVNATPVITTGSLPASIAGQAYSQTVTASGTPTPTFDFANGYSASNLPDGLTLNKGTGIISGTPSATAMSSTFGLVAINSAGTSSAVSFTLVVNSAPVMTTSSLPNAVRGTTYSQTVTATGNPAPTFAVSAGSLPTGLTLDGSTGIISGTPTTAGANSVSIRATNSIGSSPAVAYSLPVYDTATVASTVLPDVQIGSGAQYNVNVGGYPAGNLSGADSFPACVVPDAGNFYKETGCTSSNVNSYAVKLQASNALGAGPIATRILNVRSVTTADQLNNIFTGSTNNWIGMSGTPTITSETIDSARGTSLHGVSSATANMQLRSGTATLTGGHTYAFNAYVNLRAGDTARLCVYRPSDGYTYCGGSLNLKNDWGAFATTLALSGTGTSDFTMYVDVAGTGAKDVYVDDARVLALN